MMTSEADILKLTASNLNLAQIPYMLSGSTALNFYATPRMTRDIDVVIELRTDKIEKLIQVFQPEFYIDEEMIRSSLQNEIPFNIIHLSSVTKIDLIPRKENTYQQMAFSRRKLLEFGGEKISVISPEDLVLSKLLWAKDSLSETQIRDVKSLLRTVPNLDKTYLNHWVKILNLSSLFSGVENERYSP